MNGGARVAALAVRTTLFFFEFARSARAIALPRAAKMAPHPYYPLGLALPGYAPMSLSFAAVLAAFFGAAAAVGAATWAAAARGAARGLPRAERLIACWLVATGMIHLIIEGYVVVTPGFYKDTRGVLLADIWKEYSQADSRYLTRDAFVIGMEAVTAFLWGPLAPLAAYGYVRQRPWRYTLAIVVSVGQIYGDVLYYATCWLEGFAHSRPEPYYFWGYFVIVNAIWIVVPGAVLAHAAARVAAAVGAAAAPKKGRAARR